MYEGGVRVPFMVIGPGIKGGSQTNIPITGWDILPTLSELAGNKNPLPANLDGTSFKSLFAAATASVGTNGEDCSNTC